jgi:hypothetical protein
MFDKMKFPSASAPSIFFRAGVKDREQMGLQERIALSRSTDRSRFLRRRWEETAECPDQLSSGHP